jgi:hypothetical protein
MSQKIRNGTKSLGNIQDVHSLDFKVQNFNLTGPLQNVLQEFSTHGTVIFVQPGYIFVIMCSECDEPSCTLYFHLFVEIR